MAVVAELPTRLMLKSAEWFGNARARRYLATGAELELFSGVADRRRPWLSKAEITFLSASTLWRRIGRFAGIAAVFTLVVTTALLAFIANVANVARDEAIEARKQQAKQELSHLSDSSTGLLASEQAFDALILGIRAAMTLRTIDLPEPESRERVRGMLRQALTGTVKERNRIEGSIVAPALDRANRIICQ
jgi:hypothetical protein